MSWANYHSHCTFCDGRSTMEDFVKFAIAKGFRKYGFSSHAPLPFYTRWTMNAEDYPDYESEFYRLKRKYAGQIDLYLGLEVDYILNCTDAKRDFFTDKKFDYLIGSIHYLDKLSNGDFWSIDGGFREFDNGMTELFGGDIRKATKRFFEVSTAMIEKGGFDIVGHVDKITYHGQKYRDFDPTEKWFVDLEAELLQLVKEKGLMLEINTKSLREHGITYPHQNFYRMIKDMQIPVMVNSDCHYPTNVMESFEFTYKMLHAIGFRTMPQLFDDGWKPVEFDEYGLKF
ncbi:MAG: histidinol-phosphatase [Paludibacter sp.]|nr:histidinol-phosphatase [Paludibacter sp.]